MDAIEPDNLLDKFIEELPDEHAGSLKEFSGFIGYRLNDLTHENIKGWHSGIDIPIVYLFQATILRVFELGMTLTTSLAAENAAAAQIVKKHIKEKVSKW